MPLVGIGVLVMGAIALLRSGREVASKGRKELHAYLDDVLEQAHAHFFDIDLARGRDSRVDEHFGALERTVLDQVDLLTRRRSEEARAEVARLSEAARLADDQRRARTALVQGQIAQWRDIGQSAKTLLADMRKLDQALSGAGSAG
jgi:hypothetical protein